MKYIVTINNKEYEVEVEKGQAAVVGTKEVAVPVFTAGQTPQVQTAAPVAAVAPAQVAPAPQASPAPVVTGGETIKSPMPGTILDVKVTAGTVVKKGQILLILEAMKMENEIVAPTDGTVAQIQATKGMSVNTGDILAVIA